MTQMTEDDLRFLRERMILARRARDVAQAEMASLVRQASVAGISEVSIADATGLSRTTVRKYLGK